MYWDNKDYVDAVAADNSRGHRYPYRQGQEPVDLSGDDFGCTVPDLGTGNQGPVLICDADNLSGYRIVSIISYACAWRRRYQVVFHVRKYLGFQNFMLLYVFFISDRSSYFFDEAVVSKKSVCASALLLPVFKSVYGDRKNKRI